MYKKQIESYIESHKSDILRDIGRLVEIDSTKQPPSEGKPFGEGPSRVLGEALAILKKIGLKTKNYDNYVISADLNDKEKALDIIAHLDVVPPGDGWTVTGPFEPVIKNNNIYGRGTADDKGPAVCAIYAVKAVKDLNIPLKKNVRVILGADEECGSSDLSYYYSIEKEAPMSFSPDASFPVVNTEKGGFSTGVEADFKESADLPRVIRIEGGIKGNVVPGKASAWIEGLSASELYEYGQNAEKESGIKFNFEEDGGLLKVTALGKNAHASEPEGGNNAVTGIIQFLSGLPFAPGEGLSRLKSLNSLFPHGDWYGRAAGVEMEDEISGKLTISLNIIKYEQNYVYAYFDSRCPLCANDGNMKNIIKSKAEEKGFRLLEKDMRPPHHVSEYTFLVKTLLKCYELYSGKQGQCLSMGGGTYVHRLKNGVAFGASLPGTDNRMHGPDEFAVIDELLLSSKIFAQAIIELCG